MFPSKRRAPPSPLAGEDRSRAARSGEGPRIPAAAVGPHPPRYARRTSPARGEVKLQRARRQRIAAVHLAAVEAVLEPALTLFRGAVSEGIRHHVALHLLLQPVV